MKTGILKVLIAYFLAGSMFFPHLSRGQSIEDFTLINPETGEELGQLHANQTVNLVTLPGTNIYISGQIQIRILQAVCSFGLTVYFSG